MDITLLQELFLVLGPLVQLRLQVVQAVQEVCEEFQEPVEMEELVRVEPEGQE